jgi:phosphohistidine phosphatase
LWRHAEAALADMALSVEDDLARKLTPKGKRQAKRMARWLQERLPKNLTLLSSPAVRSVQTAEALAYDINIDSRLSPGAALNEVLDALENNASSTNNLLIVGHQPWLGALLAHLTVCSGVEADIKKGTIWWLRLSLPNTQTTNSTLKPASYRIYTVQTPNLMR